MMKKPRDRFSYSPSEHFNFNISAPGGAFVKLFRPLSNQESHFRVFMQNYGTKSFTRVDWID